MKYDVSVLVPVYNVSKFIERCLHTLFGQTYTNIQYIFVDDCSPDNSVEIIKQVLKEYPQTVANILCELIADLDSRGENESAWFYFHFEMVEKIEGFGRVFISAGGFDWVTYYNGLQAEKSNMLLNGGGFAGILSVMP